MAEFKLFSNPKKLQLRIRSYAEMEAERGAEILQEEFDKFLDHLVETAVLTSPFESLEAVITRSFKDNAVTFRVEVANKVYGILDEGVTTNLPRHASDYGIKAFPMEVPRRPHHEVGNRRMSKALSLKLQTPVSNVETDDSKAGEGRQIIFRPVIRNPIPARNFTAEVIKLAEKKIKDEGVDVTFTILKDSAF